MTLEPMPEGQKAHSLNDFIRNGLQMTGGQIKYHPGPPLQKNAVRVEKYITQDKKMNSKR